VFWDNNNVDSTQGYNSITSMYYEADLHCMLHITNMLLRYVSHKGHIHTFLSTCIHQSSHIHLFFYFFTSRCECGHCEPMETSLECRCCAEIELVQEAVEEDNLQCITEHDVFIANCLNRHVLYVSIYDYIENEGPIDDNRPIHKYVYEYWWSTYRFVYVLN
jgi:hypothetical protein